MDTKEFEAIVQFLKTRRHNISLPYYDHIRNNPQFAAIDDPQLDPATRKQLRRSR
jgi:pantothenate kinase